MNQTDSLPPEVQTELEGFDFGELAIYMREFGWTWFCKGWPKSRIPNEADLKRAATELLLGVHGKADLHENASGGFTVKKEPGGKLTLTFDKRRKRPEPPPPKVQKKPPEKPPEGKKK